MNAPTFGLASIVRPAPIVATGVAVLPMTASVDLGRVADRAILAQAFHYSRAARRDERNGFPYTAALKWRNAAERFAPDTQAVEHCWREWERIMHLPRRLAGPVPLDPIPAYRWRQPKKSWRARLENEQNCWTEALRGKVRGHHVDAMPSIM